MPTPPMQPTWSFAATSALVAEGIVWALVLGAASRPRWGGAARWWPIRGALGVILYGVTAGAALGLAFDTARYLGVDASDLPVLLLCSSYAVGLSLAARLGRGRGEPTRPHLVASAIVIVVTFAGYRLLEWWFDRAWGCGLCF